MTLRLPFVEPVEVRGPGPRVVPEPLRPGDPGGAPCRLCHQDEGIWADANWVLHNSAGGSLPGTVWLASRAHADSFSDLPAELAADFGRVAARVERAILTLPEVARVHLYRWGDGQAHFHVWFMPRPLGMVEAIKYALPVWEEALPPASPERIEEAGAGIAAAMKG
ncbi:HIT family protein [Hamadaea tsunoensis]|uniref:hypothetical protein n=1 Tax=Hamadaea tsunoensis TaxID=53368 RepID=UPI0012FC1F95|nr:hypothetical protein [Hamadaea tsunoensis]